MRICLLTFGSLSQTCVDVCLLTDRGSIRRPAIYVTLSAGSSIFDQVTFCIVGGMYTANDEKVTLKVRFSAIP